MKKSLFKKRSLRIRKKLKKVNSKRLRLSIYRSSRNIFAQIIDDKTNKTILSSSSFGKQLKVTNKKKMDLSVLVAEAIAKKALEKKITNVYFDRGGFKYHGRIKIFADTLRKHGLNF